MPSAWSLKRTSKALGCPFYSIFRNQSTNQSEENTRRLPTKRDHCLPRYPRKTSYCYARSHPCIYIIKYERRLILRATTIETRIDKPRLKKVTTFAKFRKRKRIVIQIKTHIREFIKVRVSLRNNFIVIDLYLLDWKFKNFRISLYFQVYNFKVNWYSNFSISKYQVQLLYLLFVSIFYYRI